MEKIRSKIVYNDESKLKYINGSFGGLNSKGEFLMYLFCESVNAPTESEIMADDDNAIETFIDNDVKIVKNIEASVIMTQETALSIYEWLGRNLGVNTENKKED